MAFLTLEGFVPPPRYDPDLAVWDRARIEEAAEAAGPWSTIEGPFTLAPPVADPARPPSYNFTSDDAQLPAGWYRVVWIDEDDEEQPTQAVELRLSGAWTPSVADVADLVRARTKDDLGNEVGTFTASTRPTASAVQRLIANEVGMVVMRTGSLDDLACSSAGDVRAAARQIVAKRVAAIVEASYYAEEVGQGGTQTAAAFYQGSWDDDRDALLESVRECKAAGGGDVEPGHGTMRPAWAFDCQPPLRW